MICFGEFVNRFKKTLENPGKRKTPKDPHFFIEFLHYSDGGESTWYSKLTVLSFPREETLEYTRVKEVDYISDMDYVSPFKYTDTWEILEVVPPRLLDKMIVRIKRKYNRD